MSTKKLDDSLEQQNMSENEIVAQGTSSREHKASLYKFILSCYASGFGGHENSKKKIEDSKFNFYNVNNMPRFIKETANSKLRLLHKYEDRLLKIDEERDNTLKLPGNVQRTIKKKENLKNRYGDIILQKGYDQNDE